MQSPRELGLPYETWRTGQRIAIRTAITSKTPHTVIQAPVGSGKTGIAAATARLGRGRSVILTATNGLLKQYQDVLPWLTSIKGMRNYECLAASGELKKYFRLVQSNTTVMCDDGPCLSEIPCTLKNDGCTYFDQQRAVRAAQFPLTNYDYYLGIKKTPLGLGAVDRLLLDEAHQLPEHLMAAHKIEIPVHLIDGKVPKTVERWKQWGAQLLEKRKKLVDAQGEDGRKRAQRVVEACTQLQSIDDAWAWDKGEDTVVFEPTIPRLLLPTLTRGVDKMVYLSGTITPHMLKVCGVDGEDVTYFSLKSRFPIDRRPVYLVAGVRVDVRTFRSNPDAEKYWLHLIDRCIKDRLDRKGLIHSVSYGRAWWIFNHSKYQRVMWLPKNNTELQRMLPKFRRAKAPAILISPSIATGYDFPGTDAEYQIIPKMPFPDTRSAIMKARCEATEGYANHITMTTFAQMVGRPMRAEDDRGETLVLDEHARWFLNNNAGIAPASLLESLITTARIPPPPPSLASEAA